MCREIRRVPRSVARRQRTGWARATGPVTSGARERRWMPSWPVDLVDNARCARPWPRGPDHPDHRRRGLACHPDPCGPSGHPLPTRWIPGARPRVGSGCRARARGTAPGAGRRRRPDGLRRPRASGDGGGRPTVRAGLASPANGTGARGSRARGARAARDRPSRPAGPGRGSSWRFGEPAPGPAGSGAATGSGVPRLVVAPDGPGWARIPSWAWHRAGVDPGRAARSAWPPGVPRPWSGCPIAPDRGRAGPALAPRHRGLDGCRGRGPGLGG